MNSLNDLSRWAKSRVKALRKYNQLSIPQSIAAAKIIREANHFGHLPVNRQQFKIASLKSEVELLKSKTTHFLKSTHTIDQLIIRAESNIQNQLFA